MRIVGLQAENVKRLKAVSLKLNDKGNLVIIGGDNAQGKTSVLDSIMYALAGGSSIPDEVIRKGKTKGFVELDLGELKVTRTFTKSGGSLKVESNGEPVSSPQKLLDSLAGKMAYDPIKFMQMDPKKQAETLRELVGLDFSGIDAQRKATYEQRTEVNREVKRLESVLQSTPEPPADTPEKEVSVGELALQLEAANASKSVLDAAARSVAATGDDVAELKADVAELEQQLADKKKELADAIIALERRKQEAAAAEKSVIDPEPIRAAIASAEDVNLAVRAKANREATAAQLKKAQAESASLTRQIDALDEEKQAALSNAKFPVDGLSFEDDSVIFNGLPLNQASGAEQLRVSIGIVAAKNPGLRVILARDGSLLDGKSMAQLEAEAERLDCQILVERVGDGDVGAIIIEDGMVREEVEA